MDTADLEFVISGYVRGVSGLHRVIGRCGDKAIRIGDVFNTAFRAKPCAYPTEMGNPLVREVERPVNLRVEHIHAYGHCLETLGEGMTGSLDLSGPEGSSLEDGWILITESKSKPLSQAVADVASSH
jgi:hypothetical protein